MESRMKFSVNPRHAFAVLSALFAISAAAPAASQQSIAPQVPSASGQPGPIGGPFPGYVEQVEALGPDRFAMIVSDRSDGLGLDLVQVYTHEQGPVGTAFRPPRGKVFDLEPSGDGGFWALFETVGGRATEAPDGSLGMALQRFDRLGRPVGGELVVSEATITQEAAFYRPRFGWIIPLPGGGTAVAFTTYNALSSEHGHELKITHFHEDGEQGSTDLLEQYLLDPPVVRTLNLSSGAVALVWEGRNLAMAVLKPDADSWIDSASTIWASSPLRGHASNLWLAPIANSDEFAAVFVVGNRQVWQRFDPTGVARSGVDPVNSTGLLLVPLRLDGGELVGLAGAVGQSVAVHRVAGDDNEPKRLAGLDGKITAYVDERAGSLVVATLLSSQGANETESQPISYLHRLHY